MYKKYVYVVKGNDEPLGIASSKEKAIKMVERYMGCKTKLQYFDLERLRQAKEAFITGDCIDDHEKYFSINKHELNIYFDHTGDQKYKYEI